MGAVGWQGKTGRFSLLLRGQVTEETSLQGLVGVCREMHQGRNR